MLLGMLVLVFCSAGRVYRFLLVLIIPTNMAAALLSTKYYADMSWLTGAILLNFLGTKFLIFFNMYILIDYFYVYF